MAVVTRPFREKVVTFGQAAGLVGVMTLAAMPRPRAPHVILINSGIVHRVGASRVYVTLARYFAAAGITTLRFDLSGIGDSERATEAVSLDASVLEDIRAAVDLLTTKHGAARVVLAGLCSGAFDAFEFALRDPRVAGAVMIDIPGPFQDTGFVARYLGRRILRPLSWRRPLSKMRLLVRAAARARRTQREAGSVGFVLPGVRPNRQRARMAEEIDRLVARGVRLSFLFTGGGSKQVDRRSQFRSLFPRAFAHNHVAVEFLPRCDHVFSTREMRNAIADCVRTWLIKNAES
jgi:pimeloyl-ACP methyl ester carboxylesterase